MVQVIPGEHGKGAPDAALVLEEFGDFGCSYCKRAFPVLASFLRGNETLIRFVYRHFPAAEVHPEAELAAEAAEAAAAQGRFWDFHDLIFTRTGQLDERLLVASAERLGLDLRQFSDDLKTHVHRGRVLQDREAGRSRGVRGTPGFYLNGKFVDTSYGLHPLRDAVRQGLAQVSHGGSSPANARLLREASNRARSTSNKMLGAMSRSTEELEAERQSEAIRAVWAGTVWIPKALLGKLAGVDDALVDRWLNARKLFSLRLDGTHYLPRYAFDERWQPLDAIRQVTDVFGAASSSLALAMWFEAPSLFLENAKPRDLVAKDAQLLVACARDCLSNEHYAG